jgi:hypothetical protein
MLVFVAVELSEDHFAIVALGFSIDGWQTEWHLEFGNSQSSKAG